MQCLFFTAEISPESEIFLLKEIESEVTLEGCNRQK
jgi:hypothetical protein